MARTTKKSESVVVSSPVVEVVPATTSTSSAPVKQRKSKLAAASVPEVVAPVVAAAATATAIVVEPVVADKPKKERAKKDKATTEPAATATTTTTTAVSTTTVDTEKPKAKRAKKEKSTEVAVTTSAPVVAEASTTSSTEPAETDPIKIWTTLLADVTNALGKSPGASALKSRIRANIKLTTRVIKAAEKKNSKRKRREPKVNAAPSGFDKPTLISPELAHFLGVSSDALVSRSEVTRKLNAYIKLHGLQDPNNGRVIVPDSKLKRLLQVPPEIQLSYFNLQRYMKVLFPKVEGGAASA